MGRILIADDGKNIRACEAGCGTGAAHTVIEVPSKRVNVKPEKSSL